ncbi:hypothetical protein, variant [Aphanomyces astaci]|uniref:FYVE-type domain-containing protein n=1 Tax=Aphanomyces astaci TaxID=112090 RepID=W4GAR8_APHAT|nr:hypothetical protein, variant [Aphanomyces astaci]ETV76144.1 hypothetical protein, variant [Aphanomyces astaci]|eukprot:XP_009834269.1 hypothetical protein, variant [Aphanomyces astaci]
MHSEHMTDSQWQDLEAEMMGLVNTAMQSTPHTRELDAIQEGYHLTSEKRNIRVLVKKSPTSAFHEFLALRRNPLSLDDYMELSYCDTTDALRAQQALFYRDNLLNAMVLAAHQTRDTDPFRFVGLKYKRLRFANSGGVFEPRDTTYFEVSGLRTNKAGHRVLFIARESVNLDDYPPVDHVVRFHFKTLILQTHYDDGIEEAVYLISNPLGSIPAFVFNKVAQASLYLVDDFPLMLQKQRCLHALANLASPKKQAELQKLTACCACRGKLRRFRTAHDCVACGYAMCSKCVVSLPRVVRGSLNSLTVVHDEVCKACFSLFSKQRGSDPGVTFVLVPGLKSIKRRRTDLARFLK